MCPRKIRTFMSKSRTFTTNRRPFCKKHPLCSGSLPVQIGFSRASSGTIQPLFDAGVDLAVPAEHEPFDADGLQSAAVMIIMG